MNILLADRFFADSNHIEAGLWIVMGIGFFARAGWKTTFRKECCIAAVTLIAFGISDIVEARTGAWWRPWWLLAWKAICVMVFLVLLLSYVRQKHAYASR